jgi:hypothetical protein
MYLVNPAGGLSAKKRLWKVLWPRTQHVNTTVTNRLKQKLIVQHLYATAVSMWSSAPVSAPSSSARGSAYMHQLYMQLLRSAPVVHVKCVLCWSQ